MSHIKNTYYFSHDYNARNDPKIKAMCSQYGAEGYGLYWCIIEMLAEESDYKLPLKEYVYLSIQQTFNGCSTDVQRFINDCLTDFELLKTDGAMIWSDSLLRRMHIKDEKKKQASMAGKKSAIARAAKIDIQRTLNVCSATVEQLKESKVNESKEKEIKDRAKKIDLFFSECWQLYPKKNGRGRISNTVKAQRYEMGDEFKKCIERYKKHITKTQTEEKYIQNGSTFWNSGYLDYTDENMGEAALTCKPLKIVNISREVDFQATQDDEEEMPF